MFWLADAWPLIYTLEVLGEAEKILDKAEFLIGKSDQAALDKVQFLRGGLAYVRQNTVCMNLYWKKPTGRTPEYLAERKKLLALRKRLSAIGAVNWVQTTQMEFGLRMRTVQATPTGGWPALPKNYQDPQAVK